MRKGLFAIGMAALTAGAQAQLAECRETEEAISEVSVQIAQAYNTVDFDKAREIGKQILQQIEAGEKSSKTCGCPATGEPLAQTRTMLRSALEKEQFSDVQSDLAETLMKAEEARREAEKCWRAVAVKQQQSKPATK